MRTPLMLTLLLLSGLVLAGCTASKVAVVNSARIYQDSDAGKAGLAYLEQVEKEVKAKAEAAQKIAEAMPDNDALPMSLQKFFISCQEAMNAAQQQAVNNVQELITTSLTAYRGKNRVSIIMQNEAVVSMDPLVDVTDAVIKEMNMTPMAFTPVHIPDFVAPPAPAKQPMKKSAKK